MRPGAVFLVLPNNPTGTELSETEFSGLLEVCAKHRILLVLDASFRFYSFLNTWNQARLLRDAGISFLVIEDTGKTWALCDLKASPLWCSNDLAGQVARITEDMLLNVSPFTLTLLTHAILTQDTLGAIGNNRMVLREHLPADFPPVTIGSLSVEWVRTPERVTSSQVYSRLDEMGVAVLPGRQFFWNGDTQGERHFRIALHRGPHYFQEAAARLGQVIEELVRKNN